MSLFLLRCSAEDVSVPGEGKALVRTDIAVAVPEGCYGRVGELLLSCTVSQSDATHTHTHTAPRSGLSWKHHLDVGGESVCVCWPTGSHTHTHTHTAGVIDRDYRGNVGVVLFNLSKKNYEGLCGACWLNP